MRDIDDLDEGVLLMPEYADCIVGTVTRCGMPEVMCYDSDKIIETLVERDGLSYEEAVEHFEFNVSGGYVGEYTPMFLSRIENSACAS